MYSLVDGYGKLVLIMVMALVMVLDTSLTFMKVPMGYLNIDMNPWYQAW